LTLIAETYQDFGETIVDFSVFLNIPLYNELADALPKRLPLSDLLNGNLAGFDDTLGRLCDHDGGLIGQVIAKCGAIPTVDDYHREHLFFVRYEILIMDT